MSLASYSIKKPVTINMVFLAVTILGVISCLRLPQELFPPINYPRLSVVTNYQNAAPEEIESLITRPIEETVGAVSGLKGITSISKEGTSIVTISFNWGTNMDFASLNVREKLDLIKDRFPRESEDPVVIKFNPFELPVLRYSVTGSLDQFELRKLSQRILKDGLEKVEGVASVSISGGLVREIMVEVDQGRLQASGISITSVVDSLEETNLNYPAGTIKDQTYEYLIRTIGEYQSVNEIGFTPVSVDTRRDTSDEPPPSIDPIAPGERKASMNYKRKQEEYTSARSEKRIIFLKEIAQIKDTFKKRTSYSRLNGKQDISVTIQKQSGANTLKVVNNVKEQLKELNKDIPREMKVSLIYDQSEFISDSISGVTDAAWQGGILTFLSILFFLRNLRSAIIVILTIPMSILAIFILMYFRGEMFSSMSLNMMSMGGLALSIGMLVDNSVVIIENIFRYREMGYEPKKAAIEGAEEVSSAIISSTLTTVAVFLPLIFVPGLAGQIFNDLAFTVCFGQFTSLAVGMALIPLYALKVKYKKPETEYSIDKIKDKILFLRKGFSNPKLYGGIIISVCIMFIASLFLLLKLDVELLPKVDQGQFMIKAGLPSGSKLEITNGVVSKIEDYINKLPDTKSVAVSIGSDKSDLGQSSEVNLLESNQGEILVTLKDKRNISTAQFIQNIKQAINKMNLGNVSIQYLLQESVFKSLLGTDSPIVVKISGFDLVELNKLCDQMEKELKTVKGIFGIKSTKSLSSPETKVEIKKDSATTYSISVDQIAKAAQTALKGAVATKFKEEGKEYDIRVQLREEDRKDVDKISELLIHSDALNVSVPLKQVAQISHGVGPGEIQRIGQERTLLLTANIYNRELKSVVADISSKISNLKGIPEGCKVELSGEDKEIKESFEMLFYALVLSIILVYMIMASQFESLLQPFIIMFTMPFSIIGVAIALFITKVPISIDVILGIILLGGIVVNNGIVLIEFINQLRAEGYSPKEAAFLASRIRQRPILMTALSSIVGLIPLALGFGESAGTELRAPMAITVMGGLITSTFLTIFVVPMIYYFFEALRLKIVAKIGGRQENGASA